MRITTNTTPETLSGDTSEYWLTHLVVVIAAGKRPAPIPNLEAKPASADGTAPGRVWESRTPPQHSSKRGVGTLFQPPSFFLHPPALTYPTTQHTRARLPRVHNTTHSSVPHLYPHVRLPGARTRTCPPGKHYANSETPHAIVCNGLANTDSVSSLSYLSFILFV